MPKVLQFRKINFDNKFRAYEKQAAKDIDATAKHLVSVVRLVAIRSMKKRPNMSSKRAARMKRYGERKKYGPNTKRAGQTYLSKGLYAPPGTPPFYNPRFKKNGLRNIQFRQLSYGKYEVGPKYYNRFGRTPVPDLHEFGGVTRTNSKAREYTNPNGTKSQYTYKRGVQRAHYPKRPFMAPAFKKAKRYMTRGRSFLTRVNTIGGLRAVRRAA